MFPLRSDRLRPVFRHVDLSPRRRCLSAVAAMHVTPRTCPGPGDLWQMSWQEEKRQAEYERLVEKFFEKYIPEYCDEQTSLLKTVRMKDILRLNRYSTNIWRKTNGIKTH